MAPAGRQIPYSEFKQAVRSGQVAGGLRRRQSIRGTLTERDDERQRAHVQHDAHRGSRSWSRISTAAQREIHRRDRSAAGCPRSSAGSCRCCCSFARLELLLPPHGRRRRRRHVVRAQQAPRLRRRRREGELRGRRRRGRGRAGAEGDRRVPARTRRSTPTLGGRIPEGRPAGRPAGNRQDAAGARRRGRSQGARSSA